MTDTLERPGSDLVAWAAEAEAAAGIARALATTAFIPDSLKVKDERNQVDLDATVAQVAAALLTGQELGLPPMASLRSIDVIPPGSGSPALRANALRALLQAHGHDLEIVESTNTRAIVRGRRAGQDWYPTDSVWTLDRAKQLGVRGFNDPKGSWQRQPKVMLVARATAEMARWIASDVLLGLPYIVEELQDGADVDSATEGEPAPAVAAGPARRPRQTRAAASQRGAGARRALPGPAPAPDQPAGTDQGEPAAPTMINARQRARLWAGLKRLGLTERDEALAAVANWIEPKREVTSSNSLNEAEADQVIQAIEAEQLRRDARAAAEDAQAEAERSQDRGDDDAS